MMPSHLVMQFNHAVPVSLDSCEVEGDVSIERREEWDSVTDRNRQDRITNLVGQAATKALTADHSAADEPDAPERGTETRVNERSEIA